MTALPTRKLEAFRYADIDALASVWSALAAPETIEMAAQQRLQQIWLPNGEDVQIRRVEMTLHAGAGVSIFALNTASRYGRIELDVSLNDGSEFTFNAVRASSAMPRSSPSIPSHKPPTNPPSSRARAPAGSSPRAAA